MIKQRANNGSPSARKLGSSSIRKPPRSSGRMRLHSIPTASIPTSRRNSSRSGANTSPGRAAATFGFGFEVALFEGADGGPIQHQILAAPEITIDGRLLETEELRELVSLIRKNTIDLSDEELLRVRDLRKKAQRPMIDVTPENGAVENVAIEASKQNKESTDVGRT